MSRGKSKHHTQEECNHIAKLRKQGLSWRVITERLGINESSGRAMLARAR
ncbi:hypothetical protein [Candidatus Pantoea communis]|nr:hypothetical protein [Pantoea communis]